MSSSVERFAAALANRYRIHRRQATGDRRRRRGIAVLPVEGLTGRALDRDDCDSSPDGSE